MESPIIAKHHVFPALSLLVAATIWGLIWYPYRVMQQQGFATSMLVTLTYFIALLLFLPWFYRKPGRFTWILVVIGLAAGWSNIGFFIATTYGHVVRVSLLFYLAPLWTILFARFLLNEKPCPSGYLVVFISFAGAIVMLWNPHAGLPLPRDYAEWLGLSAGLMFALSNVLLRKAVTHSIEIKIVSVFVGGVVLGIAAQFFLSGQWATTLITIPTTTWLQLLLLGVVIVLLNVIVQYGLARTAANQAIVILLFEVVVTVVAAWILVNETLSTKEWVGGVMIIVASLFSGKLEQKVPQFQT